MLFISLTTFEKGLFARLFFHFADSMNHQLFNFHIIHIIHCFILFYLFIY